MYLKHENAFWRASEIKLVKDINDWKGGKVPPAQKEALKKVLALFLVMDGAVIENLLLRFSYEVQIPEIRSFYASQIAIENIHNITYSTILRTYLSADNADPDAVIRLKEVADKHPSIKAKLEWTATYLSGDLSFHERLVGFACVEGIF